ncbi:hypothetical protein Tco_1416526, partial [Tanacetum coccineum]
DDDGDLGFVNDIGFRFDNEWYWVRRKECENGEKFNFNDCVDFQVIHKLCDLSSTIEMKKMNGVYNFSVYVSVENERLVVWRTRDGDEDEDEKNDEIDYKKLKGEVIAEELLVNMLSLTNDDGDDSRQNQSKYLCCS